MAKIASTSGTGSVASSVGPMPTLFKEYELVRVRQLIQAAHAGQREADSSPRAALGAPPDADLSGVPPATVFLVCLGDS